MNIYSIFILPPHQVKKILDQIIINLCSLYDGPLFESHITLLPDISVNEKEMITKSKILASRITPFTVTLGEITFNTTFFQAVLVLVKPTAKLLEANLQAKEIFGIKNTLYMPHISLLYGNHSMPLREKISKEVTIPDALTFEVNKLALIPVTGEPNDWKKLEEIPFG